MAGAQVVLVYLILMIARSEVIEAAPARITGEDQLPTALHKNTAEASFTNSELPVEQLEKLKRADTIDDAIKTDSAVKTSGHEEFHKLEAVKENGALVSKLEQHGTKDWATGPPIIHVKTELVKPAEGVHTIITQDGSNVSVEQAPETPNEDQKDKSKVFQGAARLVATSAGSAVPLKPQSALTLTPNGNRRSFNADITRETNNNVDHFSSYTGVQYSPLDMAEYVFYTGDERGVANAIEDLIQEGQMAKEDAVAFLQEIKFNIEYLKAHYWQNKNEENLRQEKMKNLLLEQMSAKDAYNQYRNSGQLKSFPFANSPDIIQTLTSKNYELNNGLPSLPVIEYRSDPVKRSIDPMLHSNIIGTSDYNRDMTPPVTEEEYEEIMEKLRATENLYTEYSLEEVIYQLAKMMFSQSLSRDPSEARYSIQRFISFLELEAERGQISRNVEKKVLDVITAALSDTVSERPELLGSRDALAASAAAAAPPHRFMHQIFDMRQSAPRVSRAVLSAYKDELTKGQLLQKLASMPGRN